MPATITGQKMPSSLTTNRPNPPDLDTKTLPRQGRAQETFERILSITAGLLAEVGIERLSTNLICERAGLTPPRAVSLLSEQVRGAARPGVSV
jgi:hypothetical protein